MSQLPEDCFDGHITQDESQEWGEDPEFLQINRHKGPRPGSLGAIIGSFKSATSKRIHLVPGFKTRKIWQRNYHEYVIREEKSLQQIADYIESILRFGLTIRSTSLWINK